MKLIGRVINWQARGVDFKMLTGLAALETGHVTGTEKIRDTGSTRIANQPVRNYGGSSYGSIDMRRALQVSSTIFFATLGSRLGHELIYEYIDRFGMTGAAAGENPGYVAKNAGLTEIAQVEQYHGLDYYQEMLRHGKHTPATPCRCLWPAQCTVRWPTMSPCWPMAAIPPYGKDYRCRGLKSHRKSC